MHPDEIAGILLIVSALVTTPIIIFKKDRKGEETT